MSPEKLLVWRQYAAASLSGLLAQFSGETPWGDTPEAEKLCSKAATMATTMMEVEGRFVRKTIGQTHETPEAYR